MPVPPLGIRVHGRLPNLRPSPKPDWPSWSCWAHSGAEYPGNSKKCAPCPSSGAPFSLGLRSSWCGVLMFEEMNWQHRQCLCQPGIHRDGPQPVQASSEVTGTVQGQRSSLMEALIPRQDVKITKESGRKVSPIAARRLILWASRLKQPMQSSAPSATVSMTAQSGWRRRA